MGYGGGGAKDMKEGMKGCETRGGEGMRFSVALHVCKFSPRGVICIVIPKWNLAASPSIGARKVELLSKFGHCRAQRRPVEQERDEEGKK